MSDHTGFELDDDVREGLAQLAKRWNKAPGELLNAELREIIRFDERVRASLAKDPSLASTDDEARFLAEVDEGIREADAGETLDYDEVKAALLKEAAALKSKR